MIKNNNKIGTKKQPKQQRLVRYNYANILYNLKYTV